MRLVTGLALLVVMVVATAACAQESKNVSQPESLLRGNYRRYEIEPAKTDADRKRAAIERAIDQHLFALPPGNPETPQFTMAGDQPSAAGIAAAAGDFWTSTVALVKLVLGYAMARLPFVILGVVALVAVCRVVSDRIAAARRRRELRGLLSLK
jgi:hypothetical protein